MSGPGLTIQDWTDLPHAAAPPTQRAVIKSEPDDFKVDEALGFSFSGNGEHLCLQVRKIGLSTPDLAARIAERFDVPLSDVGYAGMKDRQAVCTQWFTVRQPPRRSLDPADLEDSQVAILAVERNARKLRIGAHRGNQFRIRLTALSGTDTGWSARLERISRAGVPNYYGAQRFGRGMANVHTALGQFQTLGDRRPGRVPVAWRMAVSAARAYVFNQILATRVEDASWDQGLAGEVFQLDGTQRCFVPRPDDDPDVLRQRLKTLDIHPTASLVGQILPGDRYQVQEAVARLEADCRVRLAPLVDGLLALGLAADRRATRLAVHNLQVSPSSADTLTLEFFLTAGGYATSVLRELVIADVPTAGADDSVA